MWFRRRPRRPQLDLVALDRLSDTIARAVALIEARLSPSPRPAGPRKPVQLVIRREPYLAAEWEPERLEPNRQPEPEPREPPGPPSEPERDPEREPEAEPERPPDPLPDPLPDPTPDSGPRGFVLFVPTTAGYRLAVGDGVVPAPQERLRVEEEWYRVLRLGPSPLPSDSRRCVFLEPARATLE